MNVHRFIKPAPKIYHTTGDELEYIKIIGETHEQTSKLRKSQILSGYMQAIMKRDDWNGMDKDIIMSFAQSEYFKLKERTLA
jgi:hypothetical protein